MLETNLQILGQQATITNSLPINAPQMGMNQELGALKREVGALKQQPPISLPLVMQQSQEIEKLRSELTKLKMEKT